MTNKITKYALIFLIIITFFAGFLRFYSIDKVPVSLYWDEVSFAYNAYSIATTGKDEYGTPFPFLFRAFNDYKLPGNVYLMVPIVKVFGLNEITVRFPSVLSGTAAVFLFFFLIKELFMYTKLKENQQTIIGLLACFSLAISPWHIQFSRGEFEANSALTVVIIGLYFLLRGIRGKKKSFYLAMVMLPLAFTFYRSIYIFLPLLLVIFTILFSKQIFNKQFYKQRFIGVLIFCILTIPSLFFIFSSNGLVRTGQVSIFSNSFEETYTNAKIYAGSNQSALDKVIYNRRVVYASIFLQGYIKNISPQFLFFQGDGNLRQSVKDMGMLYLYEFPLLLFGLFFLFRQSKKIASFVIAWILIAPIPAALSIPSPHALRSLNMLPMPQLLVALGIVWVFSILYKMRERFIVGVVLLFIVCVSFYNYLFQYYVVTPKFSAHDWGDGYRQLTSYVFAHQNDYDKVIISGYNWQPYIYFLFYRSYNPSLFQQFGTNKGFDKYIFGGTSWDKDQYSLSLESIDLKKMSKAKNVLIAFSPQEYESQKNNVHKITEILNSNNEVEFIMGTLK